MTQDALVFLIVGAAVVYLARMWWQTSRGEKGCGGCKSACGKPAQSTLSRSQAPIQIQINGRALQLAPRESEPAVSQTPSQTSDSSSP